ncbi:metallophosphoesterase [Roseobacter denitrificans]|uniref:Calcineurin-like phosphoesterase domain-containing protein n=1 Tax=Roseobacter denitrificans (strain ATCC 33942 / OCh 114) TaxID=375451 RepID=Q167Y7_ROSDO|nr:ligase-associated DNA damage response endonuclease PdeM [Roseobacter denitrificans]ABG31706.1 conserved hypothetical protein [Roseobacter denitrificans OCh 114]AVL54653.1 metallophosphoesterase [Roseobacter denitrificans]SFF88060.1 putative phosphoesterase [Roseobacter denitrificans OCh 114]
MNSYEFSFCGVTLWAMPSGALFWPDAELLCVSDLHLGKSERVARRSGQTLPPYETRDTLARLAEDLGRTDARVVVCLGDSFDDVTAAENLAQEDRHWLMRLQAGRRWIWIEGNHDPGPVELGGQHLRELQQGGLTFRHIADPGQEAEVSGHYHPKVQLATRGRMISRRAFLMDEKRLVMPAYGTYTGGLHTQHQALNQLMGPQALAILTGPVPTCVPMPR